jgi:hypothetical protein
MAEKFGVLGGLNPLSRDEFESLTLGVQGQNDGTDIFGYNLTPSSVLTTGVGLASGLGTPLAIGSTIGNIKAERSGDKLLNKPTDFMGSIQRPEMKGSSVQRVRQMADTNKDGRVTNFEMNKFGQKIPGLDLAPMYIGGNENKMVMGTDGKMMPYGARANPYSSRAFSDQMKTRATSADGLGFYDLEEQGRFKEAQDMYDSNLKSTSDFAGDAINQTNIKNVGKDSNLKYDPNFAKAARKESIEASGSSGGGGNPTYICTALYDMGDMRAYIYKYDQLYGRRVNPLIYKGYCLWGESVAIKMKRQGWTYRIVKPIALAWARQMAYELSKGKHGKNNYFVKVLKTVGEGICYTLGLLSNIKFKKGEPNGKH